MPDTITLHINGALATASTGTTLAAAILNLGCDVFRRSVGGEARAPLCGMGICFECRVTVDGMPHVPSCQLLCRDGMDVRTDE